MPIRINLLAEAQAAEEMRRKDPVKRAIWIGSFCVFLVLLYAATLQLKIMTARSEVTFQELGWKKIEKQVQEVNDHRNRTRELEAKISALDQFTTNRMLWALALNALQFTPVENLGLFHLRTEQSYLLIEGVKSRTNDSGVVLGKPAAVVEKIVITLDGRDYSPVPGDAVPQFKQSLSTNLFFAAHLQKTNKVQLTSLSAPQLEGVRPFRAFGLQLFFQEKEVRLYE